MSYTIGDFATSLGELVGSLNNIAAELSHCDPGSEIERAPGRTAICQSPPCVTGACSNEITGPFAVKDLVEMVDGLRGWIGDVQKRLGDFDPSTPLDGGTWSISETTD